MRMRQKGQQFPSSDCTSPPALSIYPSISRIANASAAITVEAYLFAFGDDRHPLPETVKVLDEIITECVFILSNLPLFPLLLSPSSILYFTILTTFPPPKAS